MGAIWQGQHLSIIAGHPMDLENKFDGWFIYSKPIMYCMYEYWSL